MSEDHIPQEIKELFELAVNLDVDISKLYHVQLTNNTELIGELFDQSAFIDSNASVQEIEDSLLDPNLYFISPIKIVRDSWIDDEGNYNSNNFFVEWNPCIDGSLAHINPTAIIGMNKPTDECVFAYLKALQDLYYGGGTIGGMVGEIQIIEEEIIKKPTENIIDFQKYHKKSKSKSL